MPADKTEKTGDAGKTAAAASKTGRARSKAQAEFEKYKVRLDQAAAGAEPVHGAFGPPMGFPLSGRAMPGWGYYGPPMVPGLPYGAGLPPQLASGSLTERLRISLRLGADVLNAGLAGGLRVLGGLSDVADWAWSAPRGGCGCCGGHARDCGCECGCGDCCSTSSCDCGCHPSVSSCGCGS